MLFGLGILIFLRPNLDSALKLLLYTKIGLRLELILYTVQVTSLRLF